MDLETQQLLNESWPNISLLELSDWQKSELNEIDSTSGIRCLLGMWLNYSYDISTQGLHCNATWDNVYCWPPTPAGTTISRLCSETFQETKPSYARFLTGYAVRTCQENGTWTNGIKSDYEECATSFEAYFEKLEDERNVVVLVQHMLFIGSILSLLCLSVSLIIFYCFRSLWCDRIVVHAHLMLALVFRYVLLLIITEPFVFKRASNYRDVDTLCKAVVIGHLFATVSSVSWMFIQGLYLNSKLTTNVFSGSTREQFALYYFIGWAMPAILMLIYVIIMLIFEDSAGCWRGYADMPEMWILLGPIIAALVLNAIFLVNILRIVLEKVRNTNIQSESSQIVAAAKATLILFPVLGVNNLLLLYNPGGDYEKYYVILNTFFGSTQGIFVAIVYCFNSREVHEAVHRSWNRMKARRDGNLRGGPNICNDNQRSSPLIMMVEIGPQNNTSGESSSQIDAV